MAQIFPKSANRVLPITILFILAAAAAGVGLVWYYGSPRFTEVGYRPAQPVAFSHKLHAGDLGMDCRYCHYQVEYSSHANVPPTSVCMNCHKIIGAELPSLLPVRESAATGKPIEWVRVHDLPDYAYFNHAAHVRAGVSCLECHGNVRAQPVVTQSQPLNMEWCLQCHRQPDSRLRPPGEITNFEWKPSANFAQFVAQFKQDLKIAPPTDCSGCHR